MSPDDDSPATDRSQTHPDTDRVKRLTRLTRIGGHLRPAKEINPGRNLPVAIGVSFLLGALVLLSVWIGPSAWYPLVSVAMAGAMWEVLTRLRERGIQLPKWRMVLLGQVIIWISWPLGAAGVLGAAAASALALMFSRLFRHGRHAPPQNYLRDTAYGLFVLTWIPVFGSFAAMISRLDSHEVAPGLYIITFMACVIASDTGGYTAGVLFGRRPMAPAISPSKTWEGAAGSAIGGALVGALTVHFLLEDHWWLGVILGLALVVSAIMGDLVESQFKREVGIKDMSQILPGHGGLMDRLDGMLPSAVVTWILLSTVGALPIA